MIPIFQLENSQSFLQTTKICFHYITTFANFFIKIFFIASFKYSKLSALSFISFFLDFRINLHFSLLTLFSLSPRRILLSLFLSDSAIWEFLTASNLLYLISIVLQHSIHSVSMCESGTPPGLCSNSTGIIADMTIELLFQIKISIAFASAIPPFAKLLLINEANGKFKNNQLIVLSLLRHWKSSSSF